MKFYAIFLYITFCANCVFAQKQVSSDSAFYNFHNGNYPRAIQLYKQLIAKTNATYQMEILATCYAEMDSAAQEKSVLERIISMPDKFDFGISENCCRMLADIYLKEKNYTKALSLYNLYGIKWKNDRMPDKNKLAFNLDKENARSKCFEGLNMIDSAVDILTPYVFCTYKNLRPGFFAIKTTESQNVKDSLRQDSICVRYLTLLKKLHNNTNIKAELKKADADFYYIEKLRYMQDSTFLWKELICGFKFYNTDVIYMRYGIGNEAKLLQFETQAPFYSKEYQLQRFKELPLYRMIRTLPNKD